MQIGHAHLFKNNGRVRFDPIYQPNHPQCKTCINTNNQLEMVGVCHYWDGVAGGSDAVALYSRVMSPGGVILLMLKGIIFQPASHSSLTHAFLVFRKAPWKSPATIYLVP